MNHCSSEYTPASLSRYSISFIQRLTASLTILFVLITTTACTTESQYIVRYSGKETIYPAVAYVLDLMSARLVKADIMNNEYTSSYVNYNGWGRVNRFRLYISIRNQILQVEIGDVQIKSSVGGFVSWENSSISTILDPETYVRKVKKQIVHTLRDSNLMTEHKQKLLGDLNFNRIVLADLPEKERRYWVTINMKDRQYFFGSTIDRILDAEENRRFGRYVIKMSHPVVELKTHIKVEYYTNDASFTRRHIGEAIDINGRLFGATYSAEDDALTVLLAGNTTSG